MIIYSLSAHILETNTKVTNCKKIRRALSFVQFDMHHQEEKVSQDDLRRPAQKTSTKAASESA